MNKQQMREAIEQFAGEWISDVADTYFSAAEELVEHGFGPEEAVDFLQNLYSAAASEYGA